MHAYRQQLWHGFQKFYVFRRSPSNQDSVYDTSFRYRLNHGIYLEVGVVIWLKVRSVQYEHKDRLYQNDRYNLQRQ